MNVLGIETSCDETAASIVTDKREIRSNIVLSQLQTHAVFGGVVPEVAARAHLDHLDNVIKAALHDAQLNFDDLDAVAATCGPGLIGGVMVGMIAAKSIAASKNIPFIGINHLEGHILTARLTHQIEFPFLVLLVSGGHTQILIAEALGQYKQLGTTLDDACGECFDKSAKLMGLPYPGGPNIEKIAQQCENKTEAIKRFPLPSPLKDKKNCNFSFSGLKTAVRTHIDKLPTGDLNEQDIADLSYALQLKTAEILANKIKHASKQYLKSYRPKNPTLVVCGGVSANKAIRSELETIANNLGMAFNAPPLNLTGDNAAMIAWAGLERVQSGQNDPLNFKARPRWPLDEQMSLRKTAV